MVYAGGSTFWSCGYKYSSPNYMAVASQSVDGGATWVRHVLYSGSQYGYVRAIAVDPNNSSNVYAIGYKNSAYTLFKTSNGGASWTDAVAQGYSGMPYHMLVHPTDSNRLAVASSSGLYSSTDGGANWSKVTAGFSGANKLYQSGALGGLVISSTNGIYVWENWTGTPVFWGYSPPVTNIKCAVCANDEFLYAGTAGGAVWVSYFGMGSEEETSNGVPSSDVSITPNPVTAGEQAVLRFNLPVTGGTSVVTYDISGRIVQEIASEVLSAGLQDIAIDTSELNPGVYFTRVQFEGGSLSARFVVSR